VLEGIFATWTPRDGIPKIHLSTQAAGGPPGAHADFVDANDLLAFLRVAPPRRAFDCMLEAKQKDRALLRLRDDLRARGILEEATRREEGHAGIRRRSRHHHLGTVSLGRGSARPGARRARR
jgi:UV DNA damage repair endonuclease